MGKSGLVDDVTAGAVDDSGVSFAGTLPTAMVIQIHTDPAGLQQRVEGASMAAAMSVPAPAVTPGSSR